MLNIEKEREETSEKEREVSSKQYREKVNEKKLKRR